MNVSKKLMVLLLLASVFIAPGVAAYLFYNHTEWLGTRQTNKGELLNPPVHVSFLQKTKWKLLLWNPDDCNENCAQTMDKLARIRLALGRRLYEVDALLIQNQQAPLLSNVLAKRLQEEDIQTLKISTNDATSFMAWNQSPTIFIVNPENYLVLAYSAATQPKDIFLDIKHLLHLKD